MAELNQLSDEQLVKQVYEKDKQLYAEIIKRYQIKLLRYANYLVYDEDKAADVVQQTFIKAYINLKGFNLKKKFSSWIYRIAHNEAISILRKYKKELPLDDKIELIAAVNIENALITEEFNDQLNQCLAKIPLIYKEPLSLSVLEEKSYEEISEILRLPIGTVGTRINRAKNLLKKLCHKIKK